MSAVVFFPWFRVAAPTTIGGFELLPYERGRGPGQPGPLQDRIDQALAPYHLVGADQPVDRATVVRLQSRGLVDDLTEDDRGGLWQFVEVVAFLGLAQREFFGHAGYLNRDHFAAYAQGIDPTGHVTLITRRRDGVTRSTWDESFRTFCPAHVHVEPPTDLNIDLGSGIMAALGSRFGNRLLDAIMSFDSANTDSDVVPEQVEAVRMVGAFERALDCRHGDERELAERFVEVIQPRAPREQGACPRIGNPISGRFVREAWVRDLFRHRHFYAHGQSAPKGQRHWRLWEHLLLGASIFPALVKVLLERENRYRLSTEDQIEIDAFEAAACEAPTLTSEGWRAARRDALTETLVRQWTTRTNG